MQQTLPRLPGEARYMRTAQTMAALSSLPAFRLHLKLLLRETATIVVVDAVPALRVAVGTVLGIATLRVTEALGPTLIIAHNHWLRAWRGTTLGTGYPALACFTATVAGTKPALLLALFR